MADNFDEKSGLVFSETPWGRWAQTIEDIHILIKVQRGTSPKSIKCIIQPRRIKISVAEKVIVEVRDIVRISVTTTLQYASDPMWPYCRSCHILTRSWVCIIKFKVFKLCI